MLSILSSSDRCRAVTLTSPTYVICKSFIIYIVTKSLRILQYKEEHYHTAIYSV